MKPVRPRPERGFPDAGRRGFGLLELMIAMLILSVLLGLAIPSYRQYVHRGHRAQAVGSLLAAAACQERIRARNGYYDTTQCASGLDNAHYAFRIEPVGEVESLEFRVIAAPRRRAATDACGSLSLDHAGTRTVSGGGAAAGDCWGGR